MPSLGRISEFYVAEKTHGLGSTLSGSGLEQEPGSVISLLGTHVQLPWELQAVRIVWNSQDFCFPKFLSQISSHALSTDTELPSFSPASSHAHQHKVEKMQKESSAPLHISRLANPCSSGWSKSASTCTLCRISSTPGNISSH